MQSVVSSDAHNTTHIYLPNVVVLKRNKPINKNVDIDKHANFGTHCTLLNRPLSIYSTYT